MASPAAAGVNVWTPTGPNAPVFALAVDPAPGGALYASIDPGIWKSTDHAETWTFYASTPEGVRPYRLAFDPHHPNSLVAGYDYLYRTTDGGATWTAITPPTYNQRLTPTILAYDPRVPDRIYAGDELTGLYRSDDAGASWISIGLERLPTSLAIDPNATDHIFASDDLGRVFRSPNAGATWTEATKPGAGTSYVGLAFGGPGFRNLLSFGFSDVWWSLNGGGLWSRSTLPGPQAVPSSFAVDPVHPGNVYMTAGPPPGIPELPPPFPYPVFRSQDGGSTWAPMMAGLTLYTGINGLVVDATGTFVHGIGNGGNGGNGTFTYQIVGSPLAATVPALSPLLAAGLAVLLAAAGVLALRRS